MLAIIFLAGIPLTVALHAFAFYPNEYAGMNGTYYGYFPTVGELVMCDESPAVYRTGAIVTNVNYKVGGDAGRLPYTLQFGVWQYPNEATFFADHKNSFAKVQHLNCADLHNFTFAGIFGHEMNGAVNGSGWSLVKLPDSPTVYLLQDARSFCVPGYSCEATLAAWPIPDEETAKFIDGAEWSKHVVVLPSWTREDLTVVSTYAEWEASHGASKSLVTWVYKTSDPHHSFMIDDPERKTLVSYEYDHSVVGQHAHVISDEEFARWTVVSYRDGNGGPINP